ncbi:hypothetical protein RBH26_12345 [Natronolimnohabitans sp. A-GB9]|uniref:HTH domain-containing protein n=1 Tax=Natronolimnohabitans sp. A-GB9 TaxID=3069757 RepID=UPI0027AEFB1B|nr:HTH domain-containing protein [Natronolimnohabitans sp. A-GB9]MDQ2051269.1 hypothetical protein [Natronolimnohabitans sp. A-GB9]
MSNTTTQPTTVELWIRSFAPTSVGPTQERALDYLDELESQPSIESVEIGIWGTVIERTDRTTRIPQLRRIETRLEAFESWAARTGRRLEPFFRDSHIGSMIDGERHDVWRLPTIALAEFDEDDNLLHVAPCRDGDRTIDVFDRLESLLEGTAQTKTGNDRSADEEVVDRPPDSVTRYRLAHVGPSSSRYR